MTAEPGWDSALDRAAGSRLTMLVGGIDAGKTSLATFLANGLLARGFRVGVVDADLGQSEIGPPTTIGLGRVTRTLGRLGDAQAAALYFVGATSPRDDVPATIAGTCRMAERAFALGLDRVVVDTSGLIDGPLGRTLKQGKIEHLDPDLVICLERAGECEAVLGAYAGKDRPAIHRLVAGGHTRRRSASERRRHREAALGAYFSGAAPRRLSVSGLAFQGPGHGSDPTSLDGPGGLEGALVGLDGATSETLGLGVVRAVDIAERTLVIDTPVGDDPVVGLRVGRHVMLSIDRAR
jgi:polynucleotide 5'-hydroxyl-kinase GRC3/NOL9